MRSIRHRTDATHYRVLPLDNDKLRLYFSIGRALLEAKQSGGDPFAAIESILPWQVFTDSVTEAEKLAQPVDFDYLPLIGDGFSQLRRYTPSLLESLQLKAAPTARDILEGVELLKSINQHQLRKVSEDAPTSFVRKRWENVVRTEDGFDRRFYEICVLSEMKNSLRSGDIWVQGSRQFKDFEEYLLPIPRFTNQRQRQELGLAVDTDCERFLEERLKILNSELIKTEQLAMQNELSDAVITDSGLNGMALLPASSPE
ncbi:transposase [Paenibacillus algicola]|uniref:Transposase n=1 Tax=Paenibacillus algicola TaxID=2565926 RepID=A0A4P8XKC2_9BACL|nr:transposase [Paenibacillus algicola]